MKIVISNSYDPYINLATEEIILKDPQIKEDVILFYINKNTIVIGRNQNAYEEIDEEYVAKNNISIIRRISGGGAVYHDEGNINFSFITNKTNRSYEKFLLPIIEFLNSWGLNAKFKGKNDIEVNGYKVSGNAQYIFKNRMFHHGTLLFDANLSILQKALKPNILKVQSKAIKSSQARVSNIKKLLNRNISTRFFFKKLITFFLNKNYKMWDISKYKVKEIKSLAQIRKSKEWNYQKTPLFSFKNEKRFEGGTISVFVLVEKAQIKNIKFFGDFLSKVDFENIELKFIGKIFSYTSIQKILLNIDFDLFFGKLKVDDILELLGFIRS